MAMLWLIANLVVTIAIVAWGVTPPKEKYATKVLEESWTGTWDTYHWEYPKGQHVYWWEVNDINGPPMVPMCHAGAPKEIH